MRKLLVVAALAGGSLSLGAFGGASADTLPGGVEGCVASSPGYTGPTALYANRCEYVATRTGGFVGGAQSWTVTIIRGGVATNYSGSGRACNTGSTVPGDRVIVSVTNGAIAAGNPFPSAGDGTIPPAGNRCP